MVADAAPAFLQTIAAPKSLTKADAAYAEIRARILSCDLPPGSVIDQDLLAEWLGTSTTPVREAVRRLDSEHLVTLRAHAEVRVAPVSMEEFREIHTVRLGLEPLAAETATGRLSDADIQALRDSLTDAGTAGSVNEQLDASRSFHRRIYAASGNRTMTQILDSIWDRASRYRILFARVGAVSSSTATEDHSQLVAALEARDSARVKQLMRTDLDATYEHIESISDEALNAFL